MYGERLFRCPKNSFSEKSSIFAAFLSEVGVDNIDTRVAQAFVWTIVKYVVKSSDELFFMRKGYSEIVSVWWSRYVEIAVINRQEITQQKIFTFF